MFGSPYRMPRATLACMSDETGLSGGKSVSVVAADRRCSQRVPVEMWVEEVGDSHRVFRRAGNLSVGGVHLDKTIPLAVGTPIHLRFTLPNDAESVAVEGDVVSIDNDQELGMGVKFRALSAEAASRIEHYLQRTLTPID